MCKRQNDVKEYLIFAESCSLSQLGGYVRDKRHNNSCHETIETNFVQMRYVGTKIQFTSTKKFMVGILSKYGG